MEGRESRNRQCKLHCSIKSKAPRRITWALITLYHCSLLQQQIMHKGSTAYRPTSYRCLGRGVKVGGQPIAHDLVCFA